MGGTVGDMINTVVGKDTKAQKEAKAAQEKAQTAASQTAADEAAKLEARRTGMVNAKKRGKASLLFGGEGGIASAFPAANELNKSLG